MRVSADATSSTELVLVLAGELDAATVPQLRAAADQALVRPDIKTLVLDLAEVTFLDSTGVGAFVAIRNQAEPQGVALILRSPSPVVRRLLELASLDKVFTLS